MPEDVNEILEEIKVECLEEFKVILSKYCEQLPNQEDLDRLIFLARWI